MTLQIDATYSPEDNKLRLYPSQRLDMDLYARIRAAGFKWAPKQELFVAPAWTPEREDLCTELAGDIEPEQTTLAERAEAKAERLDELAEKRERESNQYYEASSRIAEQFAGGQPILVGHHSERRARKDQQRMHAAMDKSVQANEAARYWGYRAAGVEAHANRKQDAGVRLRRIEVLLEDLRKWQRRLDHAHFCLELWDRIKGKADDPVFPRMVEYYAGATLKTGRAAPYYSEGPSLYDMVREGDIKPMEAVERCLEFHEKQTRNRTVMRWMRHILNRLAFERAELGPVPRFTGKITASVLQAFARKNGVCTPKAERTDNGFKLYTQSGVPMPPHFALGHTMEKTEEGWRDFFQSVGYEVPAPAPKKPPLLNFKAQELEAECAGRVNRYTQIEMTKAEYKAIPGDYKGTRLSTCGTFRFRTVMQRMALYCVYLTDSKTHPVPESLQGDDEQGAA
jgi:hypothetical protein